MKTNDDAFKFGPEDVALVRMGKGYSERPREVSSLILPAGLVTFDVIGRCMEPAFPDGCKVFAVKHEAGQIAEGTPVVVELVDGRRFFKLWYGSHGSHNFFRSLSLETGIMDRMMLFNCEITGLWVVMGQWFSRPFRFEQGNPVPLPYAPASEAHNPPQKAKHPGKPVDAAKVVGSTDILPEKAKRPARPGKPADAAQKPGKPAASRRSA
jgi:hypothetical protein